MLSDVGHVAEVFDLGTPLDSAPVPGGLSNDLWRLRTDTGTYAVKVMRTNATRPDFRANIEATCAVESHAYARGVPCPEPIRANDERCLAEVSGELVRVHRWVDGQVVEASRWLEHAGALVARIHGVAEPVTRPLDDEPWDTDAWAHLGDHPALPADLARVLRAAAPSLARLEAVTAAPGLETLHVDSHGDLDPKNTLAVGGSLMAVDWDAAGPLPMVREATSVALDWSADVDGFRRVVAAYTHRSRQRVPAEPWVFGGWVSALGGWLVHHATSRPGDALGQQEVRRTCHRLVRLHADLERYVAALRAD